MAVQRDQAGTVEMWLKDTLIAEAAPCDFSLTPPPPPSFAQATAASEGFAGFHHHPAPACFVCGPERPAGDGLNIFAGRMAGADYYAATWIPSSDLADEDGNIAPEFIWAALDCPGGFAAMGETDQPIILGRMSAQILAPVKACGKYIPLGWHLSHEGRKYHDGTALYSEAGELCGLGKTTWITLN